MLSVTHLRGYLWRIYDLTTTLTAAATTYATLLAAVQALSTSRFSFSAAGNITAVSGNGHSVSFGTAIAGATLQDYEEGSAYFRDLYEDSKAALISAGAMTGATAASTADPLVFAEIKFRLQPIREYSTTVTSLRCA